MYFSKRKRTLTWGSSIAVAQSEARQVVKQLSPRDAAIVLGELDKIVALPCPGGYYQMHDFMAEILRFHDYLWAVRAGASPAKLR